MRNIYSETEFVSVSAGFWGVEDQDVLRSESPMAERSRIPAAVAARPVKKKDLTSLRLYTPYEMAKMLSPEYRSLVDINSEII